MQIARAGAPADQPAGTSVGLAPTAANSDEVHGEFTIASAGRMTLNVKDVAGQPSTDSFAASITLLADSKPFVRVLEPRQESFATPDVTLPVAVQAEDDYGVARLELYRGLNDSRTTAAELPVPAPPPAVLPAQTQLNLAQYGLKPGDVVKLYARAEDNDPAGAKGSESSVATVRIISTEDMQKLMLAQDVMETLQSKYEQAARRLEGLDAEMQKLLEDLAKQDPKSELAEKDRQRIDDLATQAMKESRAIERSSHQALPLDIDQAMRQDLEKVAQKTEDLARAMRELAKQKNNSAGNAKEQLDWMRKKLGASREEFQKETTEPLDHLARVFPLVEDQAEFVELYQRQRELADRMQSLEEAAKDDPKAKARMRDLQDEQRQAREDLRKLTDRIDEHVAKLPKDAKYDDLRKTASQFADNVRASDAANEMSKAEMALNDFSGKEAHGASKTAADILEKFIEKGDQVGKQGEQACMKFSPQMAGKMGNSIQQMLDAMKMGEGFGQGIGAGGGATARRSSLDNVGLYGALPRRSEWASKSQGGQAKRGTSSDGRGDADKRDPTALTAADKTKTTGDSAAAVPAAYRRRVGEYFASRTRWGQSSGMGVSPMSC